MTAWIPRILVVEDDASMRRALESVLAAQGYQVDAADNAERAVELTCQHTYDLIVSDIRMGEVDGLDAIERAKAVQPEVGTLVVSGYASEEETLRAVRLNVGGYIKKPFKMKDLLDSVQGLLEKKRQDQLRTQESTRYQRALFAAWEALLHGHDEAAQRAGLAERMARLAHLGAAAVDTLRVGVALHGLKDLPPLQKAEFQEGLKLFPGVWQLFEAGRPNEAPESLEHQIAAMALEGEAAGSESARELYRQAHDGVVIEARPAADLSGLLSYAAALQRAGDLDNARKGFEEVLKRDPSARDEMTACLGLARLAAGEGQFQTVVSLCERVVKTRPQVGLQVGAHLMLEVGLLLMSIGHQGSMNVLSQAAQAFRQAGLPVGEARAQLALGVQAAEPGNLDRYLELLLDPAHGGELRDSLAWFFPGVLDRQLLSDALLDRLLVRCCDELDSIIENLSERARLKLVERLTGLADFVPPRLVERLAQDTSQQVRSGAVKLRAESGQQAAPVLEIRSMGPFEVFMGTERVPDAAWKTQKARYLMAFLAAHQSATDDTLIELFWPDGLAASKKSLNTALSTIRSALRAGLDREPLTRVGNRISINPELSVWHDLHELDTAYKKAEIRALRRAASLYRGPFLDGCYMDWALDRRKAIEEQVAQACYLVAQHDLEAGHAQEAVEYASRTLDIEPTRQDALVILLRAHIMAGRPASAVAQCDHFVKLLKREYDAEPTVEVMREYTRAKMGIA